MTDIYVPDPAAARHLKDHLKIHMAAKFPTLTYGLGLDKDWTPAKPPALVVFNDSGPVEAGMGGQMITSFGQDEVGAVLLVGGHGFLSALEGFDDDVVSLQVASSPCQKVRVVIDEIDADGFFSLWSCGHGRRIIGGNARRATARPQSKYSAGKGAKASY